MQGYGGSGAMAVSKVQFTKLNGDAIDCQAMKPSTPNPKP